MGSSSCSLPHFWGLDVKHEECASMGRVASKMSRLFGVHWATVGCADWVHRRGQRTRGANCSKRWRDAVEGEANIAGNRDRQEHRKNFFPDFLAQFQHNFLLYGKFFKTQKDMELIYPIQSWSKKNCVDKFWGQLIVTIKIKILLHNFCF